MAANAYLQTPCARHGIKGSTSEVAVGGSRQANSSGAGSRSMCMNTPDLPGSTHISTPRGVLCASGHRNMNSSGTGSRPMSLKTPGMTSLSTPRGTLHSSGQRKTAKTPGTAGGSGGRSGETFIMAVTGEIFAQLHSLYAIRPVFVELHNQSLQFCLRF